VPVDTVEGIAEIYFEEYLATGLTVSFSPLSDCVDGCFPAHADANSNLQRPKVLGTVGPHGLTQHLAHQAPQCFPNGNGTDTSTLFGQGVKPSTR
jgi:hypothetical protein